MFVYIIECDDGSFYTGIAKDIVARLREHYFKLKPCAKYTKSHSMRSIRSLWQTDDKQTACKLEYRIKKLTRAQKLLLIDNPSSLESFFAEKLELGKCHFLPKECQNDYFEQVISSSETSK